MYSHIIEIILSWFQGETMPVKKVKYDKIRKEMLPGDVIAFGGKSHFSEIIKFATLSSVSHVATILHTQVPDDKRYFNQVIESTGHGGGVTITRVSELLTHYNGDIWWLPLKKEIREKKFNQKEFFNFLFQQAKEKKKYDVAQGVGSAIDIFDKLGQGFFGLGSNKEDFSKFFCSELVAAGLEKAGTVGSINASEITPIELCTWNIYEDQYYLLKGDIKTRIKHFNSKAPQQS